MPASLVPFALGASGATRRGCRTGSERPPHKDTRTGRLPQKYRQQVVCRTITQAVGYMQASIGQ